MRLLILIEVDGHACLGVGGMSEEKGEYLGRRRRKAEMDNTVVRCDIPLKILTSPILPLILYNWMECMFVWRKEVSEKQADVLARQPENGGSGKQGIEEVVACGQLPRQRREGGLVLRHNVEY
ncbi:hypothetical protein Ddc_03166 [Ditylenchus destructor]|nr:hypothetical protein Ddc_03166 [Ditylenchus destructor]